MSPLVDEAVHGIAHEKQQVSQCPFAQRLALPTCFKFKKKIYKFLKKKLKMKLTGSRIDDDAVDDDVLMGQDAGQAAQDVHQSIVVDGLAVFSQTLDETQQIFQCVARPLSNGHVAFR